MDSQEFLELFRVDGTFLEIRVLVEGQGKSSFHESAADAWTRAERWSKEHSDVYFGVCPRTERRGSLDNIHSANVVWADIDRDPDEAIALANRVPLPPSLIVCSGNGVHAYWFLAERTDNWRSHAAACDAMMQILGGDAVGDRARILRVPDTINYKDPDEPKLVYIVSNNENRRYELDDFTNLLMLREEKLLNKIWTGDARGYPSRSERDWSVISALVRVGLSDHAIVNIFDAFPIGDRTRDDSRYLNQTLKKAREKNLEPEEAFNLIVKTAKQDVKTSKPKGPDSSGQWEFREGPDDCLYFRNNNQGFQRIATFVFNPTQLLKGDEEETPDVIVGNVRSSGYEWERVSFTRKAFTQANALQREIQVAAWQWLGTDKMTKLYLPYLMDKLRELGLPHTRAVGALGRHGDYWVGPNVTFSADEVWDPNDAPLVYYARHKEKMLYDYEFPEEDDLKTLIEAIAHLLPKINEPEVVWPVTGWFFAAPYKPILEDLGVRFPALNLFGTRGSGKTTTLTRVFLPLLGNVNPMGRDSRTTRFVLLTLLGSTTSIPLVFTEFRKALMREQASQFLRYLLIAYDSGMDARGRPDQTLAYYPLTAPFSVDGEDMISDPAAKERIIAVDTHPETIKEGSDCEAAFHKLREMPLTLFAGPHLQHALAQDVEELWKLAYDLTKEAFPQVLPDRVRNNMAVTVLGMLSFTRHIGLEMPDIATVLDRVLENVVESKSGRTSLQVDSFITDIVNAVALRQGAQHFHFKYVSTDNRLWFNYTTAYSWWQAKRRREGEDLLETAAVKQQVKERTIRAGVSSNGQYMIEPKQQSVKGTTKWMHGIDIQHATDAGLDVPEELQSDKTLILDIS